MNLGKCKKKKKNNFKNTANILMDKIFLFAKVFWSHFTYTHNYTHNYLFIYLCFSNDSHKFL